MPRQHHDATEDDSLSFKLMLNELLQFPHLDGEEAIEIARQAASDGSQTSVQNGRME